MRAHLGHVSSPSRCRTLTTAMLVVENTQALRAEIDALLVGDPCEHPFGQVSSAFGSVSGHAASSEEAVGRHDDDESSRRQKWRCPSSSPRPPWPLWSPPWKRHAAESSVLPEVLLAITAVFGLKINFLPTGSTQVVPTCCYFNNPVVGRTTRYSVYPLCI